jgi:hypothetical protein
MNATLVLALATQPQLWVGAARWHRMHLKERGLHFAMPSPPRVHDRVTASIVGDIRTRVWSVAGEEFSISVSVSRLPVLAAVFTTTDGLFDRAQDAMMEQVGGAAESVEQRAGRFPRELRYSLKTPGGAASGQAWFSFVDRDLLVVDGWARPGSAEIVERFFREMAP